MSKRKHPRQHVIEQRLKHRQRNIDRMKQHGDFVPDMPYHQINPSDWWPGLMRLLHLGYRDHKLCSCWMCGNMRKYFGVKPIQEQKLDLRDQEDDDV